MKKKLGLLLAAVMVFSAIPMVGFAFESPLKKYSLYDDVFAVPQQADDGTGRERAMGEFYENSLGKKLSDERSQANSSSVENVNNNIAKLKEYKPEAVYDKTNRRNEILRKSSRNVYSDPATKPAWKEGPIFYASPTLESIIAKYKKSDFAGCKQECEAYVRQHPTDTLGYYYLAMSYTKCHDKDNAIKAYEKVIALHDNPMIVKYATNGRNCIMENSTEACFQNVNEPELIYPYAHLEVANLQPIDPQVLIDRNLSLLKLRLSPEDAVASGENKDNEKAVNLPFGIQDASLDAFINAPYGNGLSPAVNKEYQQLQLKKLQQTMNQSEANQVENDELEIKDIKKFDKFKTDSESIKLAYDSSSIDVESITKDPEYIKQKQEFDELRMLLGADESQKNGVTDFLPYMNESDKNVSPEVMKDIMMQSVMNSLSI